MLLKSGRGKLKLPSGELPALIEAQARLQDAFAAYLAVVGEPPGKLEPVGAPRYLPASVQTAVEDAVSFAPSLNALSNDVAAAQSAIASPRRFQAGCVLKGGFAMIA